MSTPFKEKIRSALANRNLQSALDANAERRKKVRLQSYASLPEDVNIMRQRAHDMRSEVISHLDQHVEEFIAHAEENGIRVHRATNGVEAVKAVLDIAHQQNARLVAKSKTMVGEEIHLNEALEADGIQVVETDLGEYIVQLRGERPAHIITPAVHLRREDVGKTFHEKLGIPLTNDVPTMTAAASRELRQVFLDADIGISGVNVGVVENGMLVLLTNEGNGRMVTTVPRVHIALMGIERLVPTMQDLSLVLNLLPRSATGQKLTVYVNLIHGPRQPGEPDGPEERHLILLDNGRRQIAGSPLHESLLCIRCGACLNSCPVFREIGGHAYVSVRGESSIYPGPIGSVLTPSLYGYPDFGHLVRACSLCGACKDACPVMTDFPHLILSLRSGQTSLGQTSSNAPGYLKLGLKMFTQIATVPLFYTAAQRAAGFFSWLIAPRSDFLRLPAFTGWGLAKDFPRPAQRLFRDRFTPAQSNGKSTQTEPARGSSSQIVKQSADKIQELGVQDPLERLSAELTALGGTFTSCTRAELVEAICKVLQANQVTAVQAWEASHLPDRLLGELEARGIQVVHGADPAIKAGLTGAQGIILESGALILPGGPGRPLTASLLPGIHLAVVQASQIYPDLQRAFQVPEIYQAGASALVTGPSRTADIEMTMTIGMHGPGQLHVFCLEEQP